MSTNSHQKQRHVVDVGTRASLSSSLSSSSASSSTSSSPVYGSTPGDAISQYSMTPRGTRIMYDRQFLLDCRNSPLAKSPLQNLPIIPGVTCDLEVPQPNKSATKKKNKRRRKGSKEKRASTEDVVDEHQFQLDL